MTEWKPIETAPKDMSKFDVWAKSWNSYSDSFIFRRFTDCFYEPDFDAPKDTYYFRGVDGNWRATHWMPIPPPPEAK